MIRNYFQLFKFTEITNLSLKSVNKILFSKHQFNEVKEHTKEFPKLKKKEYNVSFKVMISYFINIVENWLIL
jgi:hypothetical protein